jgi:hypothetical protein
MCASYKYLSWEVAAPLYLVSCTLYLSVITEICGYGTGTASCAMHLRGSDTSYGVRSDDLAYLALPTPTLTLPDTHTFRPYRTSCSAIILLHHTASSISSVLRMLECMPISLTDFTSNLLHVLLISQPSPLCKTPTYESSSPTSTPTS